MTAVRRTASGLAAAAVTVAFLSSCSPGYQCPPGSTPKNPDTFGEEDVIGKVDRTCVYDDGSETYAYIPRNNYGG